MKFLQSVRGLLLASAVAVLMMASAACEATETNVSSDAVETNVNRPGVCGGDAAPCDEDAGTDADQGEEPEPTACNDDHDCDPGSRCGSKHLCIPNRIVR